MTPLSWAAAAGASSADPDGGAAAALPAAALPPRAAAAGGAADADKVLQRALESLDPAVAAVALDVEHLLWPVEALASLSVGQLDVAAALLHRRLHDVATAREFVARRLAESTDRSL